MFRKMVLVIMITAFIFIFLIYDKATSISEMQDNSTSGNLSNSQYDDEFNGPSLNPNWYWYNEAC